LKARTSATGSDDPSEGSVASTVDAVVVVVEVVVVVVVVVVVTTGSATSLLATVADAQPATRRNDMIINNVWNLYTPTVWPVASASTWSGLALIE
jgi:hypothetical protein